MIRRGISGMRALAVVAVALGATIAWDPAAVARTWVDDTGKHRIEADYVVSNGKLVRLRKPDGSTVDLSVSRLSTKDQAYIRIRMGSSKTAKDSALKPKEPSSGVSKPGVSLPSFSKPSISREKQKKAETLIKEAVALLRLGAMSHAGQIGEKLKEASKLNPASIEPDFLLGILNALLARNSVAALKDFKKCLSRRPKSVAVLNNLALVEVRLKKYNDAIKHWEQAVELSGGCREIGQNTGRLLQVHGKQLAMPKSAYQQATSLYTKLVGNDEGLQSSERVGWLFMLPRPEDIEGPSAQPAEKPKEVGPVAKGAVRLSGLHISGGGTGFVVHPHYILTNRHVVEDATKIYIKDPTRSHQGFRATLLAKHPGFDLAILRCESLQAPPVKLAASLPGRGSDIMVLGYPQFDQIGMGLKSTRGAIVSTPSSDIDNMLLVDAQINSGNSGGPIVDQTGKVVAVATAVIKTRGGTGGRYGAGLPIPLAKSFLQQNVRDMVSKGGRKNPQNQKLEWPEVDAQVSRSTVLILVDIAAPRSPAGRDSDDESPFAIEDKSCPACNGTAQVKKGFTRVRCPHCRGGLDPSLIRMVPVYVPRRRS